MKLSVRRRSWRKSHRILTPQKRRHLIKYFRHFALKPRKPSVATGHLPELRQLILRLQVPDASPAPTAQINFLTHANRKNRHVRFLEPVVSLIQSVFAERIVASSENQNRLLAFHAVELVERLN